MLLCLAIDCSVVIRCSNRVKHFIFDKIYNYSWKDSYNSFVNYSCSSIDDKFINTFFFFFFNFVAARMYWTVQCVQCAECNQAVEQARFCLIKLWIRFLLRHNCMRRVFHVHFNIFAQWITACECIKVNPIQKSDDNCQKMC